MTNKRLNNLLFYLTLPFEKVKARAQKKCLLMYETTDGLLYARPAKMKTITHEIDLDGCA